MENSETVLKSVKKCWEMKIKINKFLKNSEKSSIYFSKKVEDNFTEILRKCLK